MNNFVQRSLTALILAPAIIGVIYVGGQLFNFLMIIAAVIMAYEWNIITSSAVRKNIWYFLGIFYISLPILSLIWLRSINEGIYIIFWLFSIVWSTDIGAYIFGRLIGGMRLAPKISPNKTWSGLIGGVICAGITGYFYTKIRSIDSHYLIICFSMMLAVYAQIGDLIESFIKRKFGVKDSGNIIPGHGGLLDRVDGIITTAPKVALIVILQNGNIFW